MKLSPKEENFLKHWMYDERHFTDKRLPRLAKKLQREGFAIPVELATIIAAWMPDPEEQARAYEGPPSQTPPEWPWASREEFELRLTEAKQELEARNRARAKVSGETSSLQEAEPSRT